MKLRSASLRNVRGIKALELDFLDPVRNKVRERTVIVGKNGSGKTTILEAIYTIISLLERKSEEFPDVDSSIFSPAETEVVLDFPVTAIDDEQLKVHTGRFNRIIDDSPDTPNVYMDYRRVSPLFLDATNLMEKRFETDQRGKKLVSEVVSATAGIDENPQIGNLLFFPTDRLTRFELSGQMTNEAPQFKWAYRYSRFHDQWKGSLESFLSWTYFRDLKLKETNPNHPSQFAEFKNMVNRFLEGKAITTVGLDYRVQVQKDNQNEPLGLDSLSSGEKQVVLLIGEIFRNIRKGSILLIDEPELHLHPVWQRIFMDTLTALCKKYDAQFIVTTQSPRIAESVIGYEVVNLDNLLEESKS